LPSADKIKNLVSKAYSEKHSRAFRKLLKVSKTSTKFGKSFKNSQDIRFIGGLVRHMPLTVACLNTANLASFRQLLKAEKLHLKVTKKLGC
jgi:hypothetical protein